MKNKKAVSDIVSTVLIILLVVAAIAIVGAIVINVVSKTGPRVDTLTSCLSLDIKPNACTVDISDDRVTIASFIRNAGGSDIKVAKVKAIFQNDAGVTVGPGIEHSTVDDLKKTFTPIPLVVAATSSGVGVTKMAVAVTLDGATEICPISAPITCVRVP